MYLSLSLYIYIYVYSQDMTGWGRFGHLAIIVLWAWTIDNATGV